MAAAALGYCCDAARRASMGGESGDVDMRDSLDVRGW